MIRRFREYLEPEGLAVGFLAVLGVVYLFAQVVRFIIS